MLTLILTRFLNVVSKKKSPIANIHSFAVHGGISVAHEYMNGWGFIVAGWVSVLPEGSLKSPSMHTGSCVKGLTYKCSLVVVCIASIGWANQIGVELTPEEADEWMGVAWQKS